MIPVEWVVEASNRIASHVIHTPITYDKNLNLYCKWENHQHSGSFKLRGALNKILTLHQEDLEKGLVTCSAGNHGQGVAIAAKITATNCIVFASDHAAPIKVEAMRRQGAEVRLVKGGYVKAEATAIDYARESGKLFISPYNDPMVIAGQGTIGVEIQQDFGIINEIPTLIIPVGGGGLVSGVGTFFSDKRPRPKIIGVQSEASPFAHQLFHTGSQEGISESDSIAEGLAGEIDHNSITIQMMLNYLDDMILVSEEEIREAIRYAWVEFHEIIEGSGAVGLAAQLAGKIQSAPALTIITGGNIQPELFNAIIRRE